MCDVCPSPECARRHSGVTGQQRVIAGPVQKQRQPSVRSCGRRAGPGHPAPGPAPGVGAALSPQALRPPDAPSEEGGEQAHLPPGKPLSPIPEDSTWALSALPGAPGHAGICSAPERSPSAADGHGSHTHPQSRQRQWGGARCPGHGHLSSAMSSFDCHQPLGGRHHPTSHTKNRLRDEPPQARHQQP